MRLVVDTNVVVSALLWQGVPGRLLDLAGEQQVRLFASRALLDELADVLFVLICLANQTGVDLNDALQRNLEKKTQRDSLRHKNNEKLQ